MNEDRKPVPPRPSADATPRALESVPVQLVYFDRPIQYPGKQSDLSAATRKENSGVSWVVEYLPAQQHFRITHTDPNRGVVKVGYVPESRALSWEPVQ